MKNTQNIFNIPHSKILKEYSFLFISFLLVMLFFHPVIFSDKTFFFRDIHRWFYPMKYFLASSLKAGSIPYWIPNNFCGAPFISDIQSGILYPLSLIFFLSPFSLSFNIYIIVHFLLGFCFFYFFIKESGISQKAALITGISYCYGGYTIASVNTLNNLSTIIWLPAILWSYQKARVKEHKAYYCLTIFFLCMAILGGEPQLFILSTCLLFLFSLFTSSKQKPASKNYIKTTLIILLLFLSAILITSLQLGMTYMDYKASARLGGISYEEASRYSLDINMLKHLILPLRFDASFISDPDPLNSFFKGHDTVPWLLTIYPGILIVPFTLIGIFFNFSRKILFWLVIFFITLILAMGSATSLHFIFYKILPVFRFPVKFMFLANFSLLVIAAYGFDRMFDFLKQKGVRSYLVFCLLLILMIFDLYSAHKDINPFCESDFYEYYHSSLQPVINDPSIFRIYSDPDVITPPHIKDTIMDHHIKWQMMLIPNLGLLNNVSNVGGVPALELRYQYLITEILSKPWAERIRFLKMANVKYIISTHQLDKVPEIQDQIQKINPLVYRIRDYLPRAWIVGKLEQINQGTIDELTESSLDPARFALTKGDIVNKYDKPYFNNINNISYKKNSRIHIEVTAEEPGVLVLSESSYPGWQVLVDGEKKECLWLNLLFQGVELEKGKHGIDFIFRPKYFGLFSSISLVSLALFVFIWFYFLFFAKRKQQKAV